MISSPRDNFDLISCCALSCLGDSLFPPFCDDEDCLCAYQLFSEPGFSLAGLLGLSDPGPDMLYFGNIGIPGLLEAGAEAGGGDIGLVPVDSVVGLFRGEV